MITYVILIAFDPENYVDKKIKNIKIKYNILNAIASYCCNILKRERNNYANQTCFTPFFIREKLIYSEINCLTIHTVLIPRSVMLATRLLLMSLLLSMSTTSLDWGIASLITCDHRI